MSMMVTSGTAAPGHQRRPLLRGTCTLVMSVPVTSSSTPGENTMKKFAGRSPRTSAGWMIVR